MKTSYVATNLFNKHLSFRDVTHIWMKMSRFCLPDLVCMWHLFQDKGSFLGVLLTHSLTDLSPSWEAVNCAPTQELPSILWNPKAHNRVHKSSPVVPILSQINPIYTIHLISLRLQSSTAKLIQVKCTWMNLYIIMIRPQYCTFCIYTMPPRHL
jgi:hypothetical protein